MQIKDQFHSKELIIIYGPGVYVLESVNKTKIQFSFPKVSASAYQRVFAYGNVQIQSLTGR